MLMILPLSFFSIASYGHSRDAHRHLINFGVRFLRGLMSDTLERELLFESIKVGVVWIAIGS